MKKDEADMLSILTELGIYIYEYHWINHNQDEHFHATSNWFHVSSFHTKDVRNEIFLIYASS